VNERGQYSRESRASWGPAHIGLKLFHTVGDSERAVEQIDTEMNAIVDAVYRAMGVDPSTLRRSLTVAEMAKMSKEDINAWKDRVFIAKAKATQSPFWTFWYTTVSPKWEEWARFRESQKFYNLFTSWEEYEQWLDRAKQLRGQLKEKGIKIETADPGDLSKTLGGAALDTAAKAATDIGKILKYGVIGALVIGGVVALASVADNLKSKTDPAEKYLKLAGRR
jgi:hypothetical protein